jgi:glutathione synthase/RimK-type ligase-like ATP-grasp enzyme
MDDVVYQQVNLPTEVENGIRKLMEHYRLRFAAIDMAMDQDGRWVFFEINPNGQWAWLDLVGAVTIGSSFVRSFSIHPDEAT